jgi:hypothetical protein
MDCAFWIVLNNEKKKLKYQITTIEQVVMILHTNSPGVPKSECQEIVESLVWQGAIKKNESGKWRRVPWSDLEKSTKRCIVKEHPWCKNTFESKKRERDEEE